MATRQRLCPLCSRRLVAGYPHGQPYTSADGRRLVLLVWRHRATVTCCESDRPKDCTATWSEVDAAVRSKLVRWA